jgi:transcriptional regulator with XRE-family HTH domain
MMNSANVSANSNWNCNAEQRELKFLSRYVGKKQSEFARFLHVDVTHLSNLENDKEQVGKQLDKLVRLLVLNLSPELREKIDGFIAMLPTIKDCRPKRKPEIHYNPESREVQYA